MKKISMFYILACVLLVLLSCQAKAVWWNNDTINTSGFVYLTYSNPAPFHDTFNFYNSSWNFTNRTNDWKIINGTWKVYHPVSITNHQSNVLVCQNETPSILSLNTTKYSNFETIIGFGHYATDTEETYLNISLNSNSYVLIFFNGVQKYINFYGNGVLKDNIYYNNVGNEFSTGDIYYLKIAIINNSVQYSISYDEGITFSEKGTSFNLSSNLKNINFTNNKNYYNGNFYIDNIILREYIYNINSTTNVTPSFIFNTYNSGESFSYIKYNWVVDNIAKSVNTFNYPTDMNLTTNQAISTLFGRTAYLNITMYDSIGDYAYNYTQTITIGNYNISLKDESTLSPFNTNQTLQTYLTIFYNSNYSYTYQFNRSANENYKNVFIGDDIDFLTVDVIYSASSYSKTYYITGSETNGNIIIYLINETNLANANIVYLNLFSETGIKLSNYTFKTLRLINGSYNIVELSRTNYNGRTDIMAYLNTPFYYWIIEKDGVIYKQTEATEIYSTELDFYINLNDDIGATMNKIYNMVYTLNFYNTSNVFELNFNDLSASVNNIKMEIYSLPDFDLILSNSSTSTSGILTANISALYDNDTTYIAKVYADFNNEYEYIDTISYTYPAEVNSLGSQGVFFTMIILLLISFVSFWSPAVMFLLQAIAIILTRAMTMHDLSLSSTITICVLCVMVAYIIGDR